MRALLVLAIALSGCIGAISSDDPPVAFAVEAPILVTPGASGETFLAIDPTATDPATATILACTHGGFVGPSATFVSRDGGDTWAPFTTTAVFPAGDCDVAISDSGAWVVLYDNVWGATVAVSRDQGTSWVRNDLSAPPITGAVDRPWIDWVGDRLLLGYKSVQYHPTVYATSYSDDDGATWSQPQIVDFALDPDLPAALESDFQIMDDDSAWVFMTSYQTNPIAAQTGFNTDNRYDVLHSTDGGETWDRQTVHTGPGDIINGAGVGGDRYLWWAWAGPAEDGSGESIYILHSTDRGETWSGPTAVAHGDDFDTPAIAGRADGTASLLVLEKGQPAVDLIRLDASRAGSESGAQLPLVVAEARVMGPDDSETLQSAEFMDIAHGPDGRAIGIFAWDTPTDECTGSLNVQASFCLWLVREYEAA